MDLLITALMWLLAVWGVASLFGCVVVAWIIVVHGPTFKPD